MKARLAVRGIKIFAMVIIATFVFSFIVMGLWNALIPELFHGPVLSLWQALGLLVLSHILLRSWGPGHFAGRRDRWRKRFEERLAAMTPEEREKFRSGRCGGKAWQDSTVVDGK